MKPSVAVLLTLQLCVSAEDFQQNVGHNREGKGLITDMLGLLSGFSSVVDELQDHAMGEVSFNVSSLPLCVHTVGGTSSWTRERQFGHRYLCHF